MDKNNCDNNSYFYERNYYKDVPIKDTQILEYWNNILGKDVIESIDKAYGVSIEQILFSEYSLNHKYISFATLNQEYSDMCNEKAISYLTKKGTKVLFDQFVLRFLGYGKRVLERKSRKGYIVKVIQDCFLKNLAERILDVSLSTLIFEMYLAKEQGELRGNDEAEEYNDYNQRFLGNDKYIKELFSIYPGLKRMLIELMENLANNYILLQERMEKDTLLLEDKFGGKKSWTEVKDIRTEQNMVFPEGVGSRVPKDSRVGWYRNQSEANLYRVNDTDILCKKDYIDEWYRRGYQTPEGGWNLYEIHHITPREFGGSAEFENMVPLLKDVHRKVVTPWWNGYGQ